MKGETVRTSFEGSLYSSATIKPTHLFPAAVERVFFLLDALAAPGYVYSEGEEQPGQDTIQWAKDVLLRVLPSYYLRTAEIDAFHGEIHVTWERDTRRVVAFLPEPKKLKIYAEWEDESGRTKHLIRSVDDPRALNRFLEWLYS
jgi:hypothetical protein